MMEIRDQDGTLLMSADAGELQVTHADGCWSWGPQHYMCAIRHINKLSKPLSFEEISSAWDKACYCGPAPQGFAREIERRHGIKVE